MLSLKINDIKITMAHLLLKETFDEFLLEHSKVVTFAAFEINGKRKTVRTKVTTQGTFPCKVSEADCGRRSLLF